MPLPPIRPEFTPSPKLAAKPIHHAARTPVHAGKKPRVKDINPKDNNPLSSVLTSLKKLVTPDTTPRKPAAMQTEAAADPPTQVQPPQ